jgi:hypothetical protein
VIAARVDPLAVAAIRPDGFLDRQHDDFNNLAEAPDAYGSLMPSRC